MSELLEFAEQLRNEVALDASVEGAERAPSEVFVARMLEVLGEAGELDEAIPTYYAHRNLGIEIHAYGIDADQTLNLVACSYGGDASASTIGRRDIEDAFRRLGRLWDRCRDGPFHEDLEESSDAREMARRIRDAAGRIERIQMFLVTDGQAAVEFLDDTEENGRSVRRAIWDVRRFHRLETSGKRREPITIDFATRFGGAVPCLSANAPGASSHMDYSAFLAVVPGRVLGEIYDEYGPRLLELNVRSFLQAKGGVNRGIRDTLATSPERFLAYNNGISATASQVEVQPLPGGGTGIARIRDLQIVNGGQTTASIHRALRAGVSLEDVAVQAKITVIDPARLEEIVPLISRFANSQNKVSEADLTANDRFNVEVEKLSREIWAPVTEQYRRATRWYYERARGQYADALSREPTASRRNRFKDEWPTRQKFTKTDLAKYETCWDQKPHIASLGAQKCFTLFMSARADADDLPDVAAFQEMVAKVILFKCTDEIVRNRRFGGYKAQITAYTVANLSRVTARRLDLDRIWSMQDVEPDVRTNIADLAEMSYRVIAEMVPGGRNVTEWAKDERCWELLAEQGWQPATPLTAYLNIGGQHRRSTTAHNGQARAGSEAMSKILALGGDGWLALAAWAKETSSMENWQRNLAHGLGVRLKRGVTPPDRQVEPAARILEEAMSAGFKMETHDQGSRGGQPTRPT